MLSLELKMLFSNKRLFRLIFIVLGVIAICVIDLSVKSVMAELLAAPTGTIELAPFFNLTLTYNTGVSFGLFSDTIASAPRLFATLQGGIVVGLVVWAIFANSVLEGMAISAMAGGASANVVDRFMHLRVTDYLDFHAYGWSWPAFNIADVFIVCGAIVLVAASVVQTKNKHASTNS
ncbi:signal peptidase II [Agrobacterium sp. FDAARGOS_525]|uniref:signal peptidase II n=1 Tax=Agrobacterium sp. FDAARGOS_525 TaxID=2420311 RepID=UPI00256EAA02|nr:signal peptidase II [Agrobacterium sp. FDAARGOS_525]